MGSAADRHALERQGNVLPVEVVDEGGGIDAAAVRRATARTGVVDPGALAVMSDDVRRVIFESRLSTREEADETAGRTGAAPRPAAVLDPRACRRRRRRRGRRRRAAALVVTVTPSPRALHRAALEAVHLASSSRQARERLGEGRVDVS